MKKIICLAVLMLILQGCSGMNQHAQKFNPYKKIKIIEKGKAYYLPVDSDYEFVGDEHKKLFAETKTFSECKLGNIFWRSPEFMKTVTIEGITPQYLKKAEEKKLAGCGKPLARVY